LYCNYFKLKKSQKNTALIVLLLLVSVNIWAQKTSDTTGKMPVEIVHARDFQSQQTDSCTLNKFIGDVQFKQGSDLLFCDSAYLNQQKNNIEAFGNVRIIQTNGTHVESDYLRYTGNIKQAYLHGNVSLTNQNDHLWTEELNYNLTTKIGTYSQGGTLQSNTTTVSSTDGMYNVKTKESRFVHDVYVTDSQYNIQSKDLGYNTETKMMRFFDSTTVTTNTSLLQTTQGTYDTKNLVAKFNSRSSILDKEQYIEADTITYNDLIGFGKAIGSVIIYDTAERITMYCGIALYDKKKATLLATIKPVAKRQQGNDSIFIRADTFFSEHVRKFKSNQKNQSDTTVKYSSKKERRTATKTLKLQPAIESKNFNTNESIADTTSPKYYTGFHHVKIFSDSLQGRCDSISFSMQDSIMRMMKAPIVWTRKSQLTGDIILAYMDSGKVKKVFIPENALMVSQTGPDKAKLFNQIQGKTLTANLINNALTDALVKPNAESIFFPTDESGAYIGASEAQSERMRAFFKDNKIDKILLEQEIKQTMTPLEKADLPNLHLSRFKWLNDYRPKSLLELFE
jgi:lipopolysaccharide export system protein LptA